MPKLLQINVTVNSGSTGRIAEDIGRVVISNGWESYIAYGREMGTASESQIFCIGDKNDFYVHALQTRLLDRHGLASVANTRKLVEYIDSIKPDIIHLHNIHGYYLNYPILFDYLAKLTTSVVWTLHDCWSFTGHCSHFDMVGCEKWINGCENCPQKSEYPSSCLIDRSKKNYLDKKKYFNALKNLTLVPVSDWLSGLVDQSFLKDNKVQRIYNGVDTDAFKPQSAQSIIRLKQKYGIAEKNVLLGVASVWSPRKGLEDFVKLSKLIGDDKRIVLIGLTDKQIADLPSEIIGISRTESLNELVDWYNCADLFINPTYEDNFPTTNLEALSCGTPVVTYQTGGSVEAVNDACGFIIKQGDLNLLIEVINTLKFKGKSHYTAASRQRALECFSKDDRFAEYLGLYNKLIDS